MNVSSKIPLRVPVSKLSSFYENNPDFDLLTFDFFDSKNLARLAWPEDVDAKAAVKLLRAQQRTARVCPNGFAVDGLIQSGFDSAHKIASVTEDEFVAQTEHVFEGNPEAARTAYQKALTIKGQTTHLWANVQNAIASPHARNLLANNISDEIVEFFTTLPTYADLFGTLDYCECEQCQSIFGPAAYFVDLMRITDRYISQPNIDSIPEKLTLESRRKGLFTLPLTCASTNDLIPYIQIVNQVLADRAALELGSADVYHSLALQVYPFNLPVNILLNEIGLYLNLLEAPLSEIYATFRPPQPVGELPDIAIARQYLGLSIEQLNLVTTPTPNEASLKIFYGLRNKPLTELNNEPFFLLQTGLSREALTNLLYDNLNDAETKAGLAHQFFFNLSLPNLDFVSIERPKEGDNKIKHLTLQTLDCINRFVRLAQWIGIPFTDLAWLLNSIGATEITAVVIRQLAQIKEASAMYGLPTDRMAAFWYDIKTTGVGYGEYPEDLFDRVYNQPSLLNGRPPYHPAYDKNPLYTGKVEDWKIDSTESVSGVFGKPQLMAALGLSDTDLTALGEALFGKGSTVPLNVPNLSKLYRMNQILVSTKLSLHEYQTLLSLLGIPQAEAYTPGNLIRLKLIVQWLQAHQLSVDSLNYILTGKTTAAASMASGAPVEYSFMRSVWALMEPGLLQPYSFVADLLTAEDSEKAFLELLKLTDPRLLVSVRLEYERVFTKVLGTDVALVLRPVTEAELEFLRLKGFTKKQIRIIASVLLATYNAQMELLNTEISTLLDSSVEVLQALTYYAAQSIEISPLLQLLLTPVVECTAALRNKKGKCKTISAEWQKIIEFFKNLSRATFTASRLNLSGAEIINMADNPAAYDITEPLQPSLDMVRAVFNLQMLEEAFGDTEEEFLAYLGMDADTACDKGTKSAALAVLTGWNQAQICRVTEYLGEGPAIYDTIDGITRMKRCFDLLNRSGMDAFFINNLLKLSNLSAQEEANWKIYRDTAQAVVAVANAKYQASWTEVNDKIVSKLNEQKRNALVWLVLWQLRKDFPTFTSLRQLYEFLLIDVEMSGCAMVSAIVEGISAVQLYLQRCRLNLELGVDKILIPQIWWEWMTNYRIWEANRKIFVYPENYLIPSLRKSKTSLFKTLEDTLQQSDLRREAVESSFRGYLDGLSALTTLTYIDAYQCIVDDGIRGPVETLFLFSRTKAEPYTYYYNSKESNSVWADWRKIDIAIGSQYITPIYAFSRLFIFWVEVTRISSTEIASDSKGPASNNQAAFWAAVRYSFYDFSGNWVTPQTLYEEQIVYVSPSTTTFTDASGFELFNTHNLYWHKVNAILVTPENLNTQPENTSATEKIVILYGPFLENNVVKTRLEVPPPPPASGATKNPPKFVFDMNVHNKAVEVNQAIASPVFGPTSLIDTRTLNNDLNLDFILRSTEFLLLTDNRSAGIPPAISPKLDVALSTLNVNLSFNPLKTNYYGDYTSRISTAVQPTPVVTTSFIASGINAEGAKNVFNALRSRNIILTTGKVNSSFSLNTDLSFLFPGETNPKTKAALIAVVQEILLGMRARDSIVKDSSFVLPEINSAASTNIYNDLKFRGVINADGYVRDTFTSSTDLSFLFGGAPPEQKQLLISEVRRVLFANSGEPKLLGTTARDNANTIMVKNQPNNFIINNGDEAFLVFPDTVRLPSLSSAMRISDISSEPTVFDYSFVTPDIDLARSKEAFSQLKANPQPTPIITEQDKLSSDFDAQTSLAFLFPGTPEPKKSLLIAQVREVLLNLSSITGIRYYYESNNFVITDKSFITFGIDAAASAEVYELLVEDGLVSVTGVISKSFTATTDLDFLFPDAPPQTRPALITEVRIILLSYYAATWQQDIHDLKFRFVRLTTGSMPRLSRNLFAGGIDSLLALESQQVPVVPELPFTRYNPQWRAIEPVQFDGAQVDFDGPYGLYYWELFFFSPQLIAVRLSAERRFEEAQNWFQYIFNPTIREKPLSAESFITPDISKALSAQAYQQLKDEGIITAENEIEKGFNQKTYLNFLWPEIPLDANKELMIREVRNILLNYQVGKPSSRYWQFQPFRNHTLQSLLEILTDEAQIAIYNNNPFDPFAIARLRIGAFEKSIVMSYLDNLIAWGDAFFTQYTWEALTAASMLYVYAYNLLGDRPVNVGACPSQPSKNFDEIRKKYQSSKGIPQFLIDMENLIPTNSIVAPELFGKPFNEIDAYFCVPENQQMLAYWDIVDDRLYKIRNCLDLEGKPLKLPLFAPPINPLELVRASAAGQSSMTVVERQSPAIPAYRFSYMIIHARSLVQTVTLLGSQLQAAFSARDNEALARLRANQDLAILNLTTQLKTQQIEFAKLTLEGLQVSASGIKSKQEFYNKLLKEGLSAGEVLGIVFSGVATGFRIAAGIAQTASAIAYLVPNAGSPFAMTYGGIQAGNSLAKWAAGFEVGAQLSDWSAQTSQTIATYDRRAQDWQFQADQTTFEATQMQKQVDAANVQLQMATRELQIHQKSIEQTKELQDFLTKQFDSQELYVWIANRVSTLYFQAYKLALDAALSAQSAYRFELNRDDNFINFNYWDNLKQGLLAGEGLDSSLNQMERAFVQNNTRRLEVKKAVSLAAISPDQLFRLKTTGECNIIFSEELFDFDFPGHYCRQTKSIEVRLDTGETAPSEIHATLTQIKNDLVLKPSPEAVAFLINGGEDPPLTIRRNWQAQQQIAFFSNDYASGMLESVIFYTDERYLPFEGTGAVSEWIFTLPQDTNNFDLSTITDLVITIGFSALNGGKQFHNDVRDLLSGHKLNGSSYINIKEEFSDDWEAFMTDHEDPNQQILTIQIDDFILPPNVKSTLLNMVYFQLDILSGVELPATSEFMTLTVVDEPAQKIPLAGRYGKVAFNELKQEKYFGEWQIKVDLLKMKNDQKLKHLLVDGFLDPNVFENLEIILEYKACVFKCV